jgi:hypothetical protein
MDLKRTLVLAGLCGVLAALLSSAATSGSRRNTPPPVVHKTTEVEAGGAALAAEIARLHERLRPTTSPQQPGRNLFEFSATRANRSVPAAPAVPAAEIKAQSVPATAPPPLFKLIGIAEDVGADGPSRTAIISGLGELYLVKQGDGVTLRYRVAQVSDTDVELRDVNDGATVELHLK